MVAILEILKKHSALVSMTNKNLTLIQKKALNTFYMSAKKALESGQEIGNEFTIQVIEVERILGLTKDSRKKLLDELSKLSKIDVKYDIFTKDKKTGWGIFGLLGNDLRIDIDKKTGKAFLTFRLAKMIEENLIKPNVFASIDLEVIKGIRIKYAVAMYELLEDYKNVNVPYMSIEDFREFLGIDKKKYPQTAELKRNVIVKIVDEINEKTKFKIDYEFKKEAQKIVGIQWKILEIDDTKQKHYLEKRAFIEKVRTTFREGEEIIYIQDQEVKIKMGKNGLLVKHYDYKKRPQIIKKELANDLWTFLFQHQGLLNRQRDLI